MFIVSSQSIFQRGGLWKTNPENDANPSPKDISYPAAATVLLMDVIQWPWRGGGQPNHGL